MKAVLSQVAFYAWIISNNMRIACLFVTLSKFAGCATWSQADVDHHLLSDKRVCDANTSGPDSSAWQHFKCSGTTPLPPECEKPNSDDLPACREWVLRERARLDEFNAFAAGAVAFSPTPSR